MTEHPTPGEPVMIPLDLISDDTYYQPRTAGISESHVKVLMESDPAAWPPALISPPENGMHRVIDGAHRVEAARRLKLPALPCRIDSDADYFTAVQANIAHGLPLAINDRKAAARWLAKSEPNLSLREIGRRVGLSDKTVRRAIESGNAESPQESPARSPLSRWFSRTYGLDPIPSSREVARDIALYDDDERSEVARVYADIGKALVDGAAPYLSGENR